MAAQVGTCALCGQQMIKDVDPVDAWHPYGVEFACPPEPSSTPYDVEGWQRFHDLGLRPGRPGLEYFVAEGEAVDNINPHIVNDWLKRIEYKPNARIKLGPRRFDDMMREPIGIVVEVDVPDSYDPEQIVTIVHERFLPYMHKDDFDHFVVWMRMLLHSVEMHEADEFFKVDGKRRFDPHAMNKLGSLV